MTDIILQTVGFVLDFIQSFLYNIGVMNTLFGNKRMIASLLFICLTFSFNGISFAEYGMEGRAKMKVTSPAFGNNDFIPKKYTCQGDDVNPPLAIENVPVDAKSLALIVDDPDAPVGTWVHWVVFDIPIMDKIDEKSIPGKQGINDFGKKNYGGPCPPSGIHRYFFKIYALDTNLTLREGVTKSELEGAMKGHIVGNAELVGLYKKE